jgi:hypothetical protein
MLLIGKMLLIGNMLLIRKDVADREDAVDIRVLEIETEIAFFRDRK